LHTKKNKGTAALFAKETNLWEERNWNVLQDIIQRLQEFRTTFTNLVMYDPEVMLDELYTLQDRIQNIWNNQFQPPQAPTRKYGADDFLEAADDETEDEDEDEDEVEIRLLQSKYRKQTVSSKGRSTQKFK